MNLTLVTDFAADQNQTYLRMNFDEEVPLQK